MDARTALGNRWRAALLAVATLALSITALAAFYVSALSISSPS